MQALENRIPPPIVAAIFAIAMWGLSFAGPAINPGVTARVITISVLLVVGAFFAVSGLFAFKRAATTVNPLKPETASSLVDSGIFRISRNPMYVGLALFLTAWAVHLSSLWAFMGVLVFVAYMNRFQIRPEERALQQKFGSGYEQYQSRVRRWL